MYGAKHTAVGGCLAFTGLALGWEALAAVTLILGGIAAIQLMRRSAKHRP